MPSNALGIAYEPTHNLPNCQLNRLQQIQNSLAPAVVKAPKSTHIIPILKSIHWLKVNEHIEYKLLSLTYKVLTTAQPSYGIFTTLSLFNLLTDTVAAPHLLSLFLARQPSPPWQSQIAHLDTHHLVFWINFQIHSVSLTILVSIHFLIHFSTHLCQCHHPLSSSITPSLQAQNLPFQHILPTVHFFYLLDCLTIIIIIIINDNL